MPTINITAEAMALIRAAADQNFRQTGTLRPNGDYDVPVGEDTLERLQTNAFEGETTSDTIVRMFATYNRKAN